MIIMRTTLRVVMMGLALASCLPVGTAWIRADRECDPGCTRRGNCNKESGQCDCPPGWAGPKCEEAVLGACRSKLDPGHISATHGTEWPKTCECLRQIEKLFTLPVIPEISDQPLADHRVVKEWGNLVCYERTGLAPEQQFSDVPDEDESGVVWYSGKTKGSSERFLQRLDNRPKRLKPGQGNEDYKALKHCKDRCQDRGACYGDKNGARCICSRGYTGESQGLVLSHAAGDTPDCSRTSAWTPDPKNLQEVQDQAFSRTRVRIYRYELPWTVSWAATGSGNEEIQSYDGLYSAADHFLKKLLHDPEVLTENPYEANLFYVQTYNMYYGGNIFLNTDHIKLVLHYISQTYPTFFNRHKGKDHIISCMADWGACQLDSGVPARTIKLSLWGPVENSIIRQEHKEGVFSRTYGPGCYNPARDVVLPVRLDPSGSLDIMQRAAELYATAPHDKRPGFDRKYLMYFGGGVRYDNKDYSAGSRQAFYDAFVQNETSRFPGEVKFQGPAAEFALQSQFCLIFGGEGFPSTRLTVAMHTACIPVIIMDHIYQPFHDLLPYRQFSVRIAHKDIPNLINILKSIPDSERAHLRHMMSKHYHAFNWFPHLNGTAYHYTVLSLHRRINNLWGYLYKK